MKVKYVGKHKEKKEFIFVTKEEMIDWYWNDNQNIDYEKIDEIKKLMPDLYDDKYFVADGDYEYICDQDNYYFYLLGESDGVYSYVVRRDK